MLDYNVIIRNQNHPTNKNTNTVIAATYNVSDFIFHMLEFKK